MGGTRYYRCPDCDHVLDSHRFPSDGPCPHCVKATRAWGLAKARGEIAPHEELTLKSAEPHALDHGSNGFSQYFRAVCIAVVTPVVFFVAMPLLFSTQTGPTFAKVQYLAEYQQELEAAASAAEIAQAEGESAGGSLASRSGPNSTLEDDSAAVDAVPERLSAVMRDGATKRELQQLLSLLTHGKELTRMIGLLSGVFAGLSLGGLYLRATRRGSAYLRANATGFLVILALLAVNLSAVRYARAEAVGVYEVSTSAVDNLVGFLLHQAISEKNTKLARRFLSEAGALDYKDERGALPLHLAVEAEMPDLVSALIERHHVDVNGTDTDGASALMYAARVGNRDLTQSLIQAGAQPGFIEVTTGRTALHAAAAHSNVSTLRLLLDHGGDPNVVDLSGVTALMVAARTGNRNAMSLLVEGGADPNIKGMDGQTTLQQTLWKVLDRIDGARSNIALTDLPDAKLLELLLGHGADANLADPDGQTPLQRTAATLDALPVMSQNLDVIGEIVELFLQHGADAALQGPGGEGSYRLAHAARVGRQDHLALIYEIAPSKLNDVDASGKGALQVAIVEGNQEAARFLLEKGADLSVWKHSLTSPLDFGVDRGDTAMVALLLEYGGESASRKERRGGRVHVAARNGDAEIIELLLEHGYDPNIQEARGNTALHLAASNGCVDCVKSLLAHGADPTTWNAKGKIPLAVAREAGKKEVEILLKYSSRSSLH